jgi:hypothetical protein
MAQEQVPMALERVPVPAVFSFAPPILQPYSSLTLALLMSKPRSSLGAG